MTNPDPRHIRILASAGTGKTYQLASRFLKLVLDGADPTTILATTFTRAAAAEIRDRVLTTVAHGVLDEEKRSVLAGRTGRSALEQEEVDRVLETLVRDLDRLQIQTIDSTFASIAGAAAPELGLPADLGILESDDQVGLDRLAMAAALEETVQSGDPDAFLEALQSLGKGGASGRSVVELMDRTINENLLTYHDAEGEPGPWLWADRTIPPPLDPDACVERLRSGAASREASVGKNDAICKNLRLLADRFEAAVTSRGGPGLLPEDWTLLFKTGVVKKILDGESTYSGCEIDEETHEIVRPLIQQMHDVALADYARRTASTFYLIDGHARSREALRSALGVATFDDVVRLLRKDKGSLTREDLWFRLDARVRHLMLDEFQDTSLAQWKVLQPLAEEIVSDAGGERTFFCVGDVKQSIYGWRGGLPGILEHLDRMILSSGLPAGLAGQTLSKSWRSAPQVLDAVNMTFGSLESNPAIDGNTVEAARSISSQWEDHLPARDGLQGLVELRSLSPASARSADVKRAAAEEAAALVQSILVDHSNLSIGVLAPRNDVVGSIVTRLRDLGVEATGEGGGSFLDCGATVVMMDALHLAAFPGARAAAFNVLHSPLGPVIGLDAMDQAASVARRLRMTFREDGLARTVEHWVDALEGSLDRRETGRVQRMVIELELIEQSGESRPDMVARLLERTRLDEPGGETVKVMTIHKSKGLEFDVVVLTGLDGNLFTRAALAHERVLPPGDITRVFRWANETVRPPSVEALHQSTRVECVRERLCQLYVAMTRARRGLFMLVGPAPKDGKGEHKSMAGILRGALTGHGVEVTEESDVLARFGTPEGFRSAEAGVGDDAGSDQAPPSCTIEIDAEASQVLLQGAAPSSKGEQPPPIEALGASGREAAAIGTAWHHLMEQVDWIEDWEGDAAPSRDALAHGLHRLMPTHPVSWHEAVVDQFLHSLTMPAVRQALSRELLKAPAVVHREWEWLGRTDSGASRVGIIDRVVIEEGDASDRRAMVIDWKTDQVSPGQHAGHAERYRDQLNAYRAAVGGLAGLDASSIRCAVVFVRDGICVELDPEGDASDSDR